MGRKGERYEKGKLKVIVNKRKAMRCSSELTQDGLDFSLNREDLEKVECFGIGAEVDHRVGEGAKVLVAFRALCKERSVSVRAKVCMFKAVVMTVWYRYESWDFSAKERKRVDMLNMNSLRTTHDIRQFDYVRHDCT